MCEMLQNQKKETIYLLVATFILAMFVSPLFLLGQDAHIRVHDNLDSNLAWYRVLSESGEMFGEIGSTIPQIINGELPRSTYGTEFSGIVWLHAVFPSMTAYAISQLLTRVFAFIGMYLLLKRYVVKEEDAALIRVGVALAFSLTPFWPSGMLSTLGHPLALWAFLNIRAKDYRLRNWLTLGLLPLYASFVLGFFFFLVLVQAIWLYDFFTKRKVNIAFLGSIAFMTSIFLAVEYRLVASILTVHEPMHRIEFISSRHDLWHSIKLSLKNFFLGHTHVMTVHAPVILPILFMTFFLIIFKKKGKEEKAFLYLLVFNYALSLWYALWFNQMWRPLKEEIELMVTFNFARFHFLRPLVIYVSFALGCLILWRKGRKWRLIVWTAILAQVLVLIPFNEEIKYGIYYKTPSFREFFAEKQFQEIEDYIGKPQANYRVASIGIHPSIAQYNGFYTLDTYNNLYPLSYKYEFRDIIANELEKNTTLRKYYDEWGSRCYIFVDELGKNYDFRKNSDKTIKDLALNTDAFIEMGGRYVFSAVPILNAPANNLQLEKVFNHPESAWTIYLYQAIQHEEE
ncbi:DUF6044 family protein [Aquibacillus salsiterrae]|uniref:DUF6044 family protein n=1 Tax=Aquibacillus salsiterrae TaxID=2950439 RepID=A0A9X4AG26_9BACI|nr:DUF6044 family protein [Aquibacillus salsiterrae]MDC3418511.1 DUF6044 family protein [Aquibacillus salsiterrae]